MMPRAKCCALIASSFAFGRRHYAVCTRRARWALLGCASAICDLRPLPADGIFQSQFDLRATGPVVFNFIPDSRPNEYIARAFQLPDVRLYWNFARFPSIISFVDEGHPVVELGENRFQDGRRRGPQPFTYRVVFDDAGNVIEQGWLTNGMLQSSMRRMVPQQPEAGVPAPPAKKSP